MKRICLTVPSLKVGGQERVMAQLANYFAENKDEQIHLLLYTKGEKSFPLSKKVIIHEPDFYFNTQKRLSHTVKTILFIRKTIKKIGPDVLLSFGEIWNNLVLLSTLFIDVKKFVSDRCSPTLQLPFPHNILRKLLYRKVQGIISQTNDAKEHVSRAIGHPNIIAIGNPISPIPFKEDPKENIILNVGRFITEKRQKLLVKIFSEINPENWKLVFLGGGALLEETKEYAKSLGLMDKVVFEGEVKDVLTYYQKSKIFAYASVSEGFPNALAEALSAGLPTVSTNFIAGAKDLIIDNYNGYLIPENDHNLYKKKLIHLINSPETRERFAENSKEMIRKFEPDFICERFYDFLLK